MHIVLKFIKSIITGHRMAIAGLLYLALFSFPTTANAGGLSVYRYTIQQRFIESEIAKTSYNRLSADDTAHINRIFHLLNASWAKHVKQLHSGDLLGLPLEVFSNLDAYSYYFTILRINKSDNFNPMVRQYFFKNFLLPSMIKDVVFVKENINLLTDRIIWPGTLSNVLHMGTMYNYDKETFTSFYKMFSDLKEILYVQATNLPQEQNEETKRLRKLMDPYELLTEARKSELDGDIDQSLAYFSNSLSKNRNFYLSGNTSFTTLLIDEFSSNPDKSKIIELLNTLFINSDNDALPRAQLRTWYVAVDPIHGSELFQRVSAGLKNRPLLVTDSAAKVNLASAYACLNCELDSLTIASAKIVLVDFWHSSCMPCLQEIPQLNDLFDSLSHRTDLIFISVNTDQVNTGKTAEQVKQLIRARNIKFPVIYDNAQANLKLLFGVSAYPTKFIIQNPHYLMKPFHGTTITYRTFFSMIEGKQL